MVAVGIRNGGGEGSIRLTVTVKEKGSDRVVGREERVLELRQDGVVVADDAVDDGLALRDARHRVVAHLLLDGSRHPAACSQLAKGAGSGHARAP